VSVQCDYVFKQRYTCNSLHDSYLCNCNLTENMGPKLCMDSSSPELFDDLQTEIVDWCRLLDQIEK